MGHIRMHDIIVICIALWDTLTLLLCLVWKYVCLSWPLIKYSHVAIFYFVDELEAIKGVPIKMQTDLAIHVHMGTLSKVSLFQVIYFVIFLNKNQFLWLISELKQVVAYINFIEPYPQFPTPLCFLWRLTPWELPADWSKWEFGHLLNQSQTV